MFESLFLKVGVIVGLAAAGGAIALLLRQPLIVAFIAVGILIGPAATGWVVPSSEIELFSRLGIALLLFVVGLKLDLHVIRTVGPVALAAGLGQVAFTSAIGFAIALGLGMGPVTAAYVAVALTFSSTIIIVKLLSDKREVDALHGRIAVGFLIVQDIVVVLVMIALTAAGEAGSAEGLGREAAGILVRGTLMLASVALLMRFVLPAVLRRLAQSPELLVLFSIAWAVLAAAAGDALGFSKEVGAFLAGVSIASTPYRELVAARLVSLRDFLLLFFFIELGATLDMTTLGAQLGDAAVLSLFVLVGNPFIVMAIMGFMGYRRRTGFLCGLTVAQISEFSLILAALGASLGHIDADTVGLITLVGLVTISASTYMILYSHRLYEWLGPHLAVFERRNPYRERGDEVDVARPKIVVIGIGRFGSALVEALRERGCPSTAVDMDPDAVHQHQQKGHEVHYGDATDPEFLAGIPMKGTEWIVSTLRDVVTTRQLLFHLRDIGYGGQIAVAAAGEAEGEGLTRAGADLVLVPYEDAARQTAARLAGAVSAAAPSRTTGDAA
jgi:Kef-type K+ transport system membrane component KefB